MTQSAIMVLIAANVALLLGPVIYAWSKKNHLILPALDGFVLLAVSGLVILHVLPDIVTQLGLITLPVAIAGFMMPGMIERFTHVAHRRVHTAALLLGFIMLLFHEMTDGIALGLLKYDNTTDFSLAFAIIIHRLPVGIAIWWLVKPQYGAKTAAFVIASIIIGTLLGVTFGQKLQTWIAGQGILLMLAFAAGALLHVLLHRKLPQAKNLSETKNHLLEALGALLGIAALIAVSFFEQSVEQHIHEHITQTGMWQRFLQLSLQTAPALLFGLIVAGVFVHFIPKTSWSWLSRGRRMQQTLRGVVFGLPLPVCSCGVVPLYQSLVKRGVASSAAIAFLVATPELGVEALLMSIPLLGAEVTLLRLLAAFLLATFVGLIVGYFIQPQKVIPVLDLNQEKKEPLAIKIRQSLRYSFIEMVDDLAAWILVGLIIAAAIDPGQLAPLIEQLPKGWDVVLCTLIGIPIYVCASGATPLAAMLFVAGVSPGAVIAFLLAGPATNVTTFGMLKQLHGTKVALLFGFVMLASATALGYSINLFSDAFQSPLSQTFTLDHGHFAWWQFICLGIVSLAFAFSLLRQGPRQFITTLTQLNKATHTHHKNDNCC